MAPTAVAFPSAVTFVAALLSFTAIAQENHLSNVVCRQNYCVNPVFPALEQLPQLEARKWVKHSLANVSQWMEFCGGIVDYDPALPYGINSSQKMQSVVQDLSESKIVMDGDVPIHANPTEDTVVELDRMAAKSYFFHLSGMGIEAWDHSEPTQVSSHPLRPCARSVANLVCFTYFPKAYAQLPAGQEVRYVRPCANSCENYKSACNVECCGEDLKCVWDAVPERGGRASDAKTTLDAGGKEVLLQTGYVDAAGPSFQCTGVARRQVSVGAGWVVAMVVFLMPAFQQRAMHRAAA